MNIANRPQATVDAAVTFIERQYGIKGTASSLPSERDQNFRIDAVDGSQHVLKIAHPDESAAVLDLQTQALCLLEHSPAPELFPSVRAGLRGELMPRWSAPTGEYFVRLVSYLPGTPVADISELDPSLLVEIGRRLGEMDRTLESFSHPAMHRFLEWDSKHAFVVIQDRCDHIDGLGRRELVQKHLDDARARLVSLLARLPMQVIHNDVNDHNLLIENGARVSGIIDFGDMMHSYRVCDLANAAAYLMFDRDNPFEVARYVANAYDCANPLSQDELRALPDFIRLRLCLSVCMCATQKKDDPDNAYLTISEAPAWRLLERLAHETEELFAMSGSTSTPSSEDTRTPAQIMELRRRFLSETLSTSYRQPIKVVRGSGQYLYDDTGRQYLDCVNNVCHVGHCHPRVVAAAREQIAQLNTNTRYLHDNIVEYASRLTSYFPDPLSICFFVNSGSEANDLALRLARTHTDATDMIVLEHAYHGHTQSLIDISPYKHDGKGGRGAPQTTHSVPIPDRYRGAYGYSDPLAGQKYGEHVRDAVSSIENSGRRLAGFIAESILGVAGQIELPPGYLAHAYETIRAAGGVCIADEVQVGFGRVGDSMWAFEAHGVTPDIVTLGKPIGNGHPLAVVITTPEVARSFETGMEYFNTFGGNPVSCAIGLAVLEVIEDEKLRIHAHEVGGYFFERLHRLATRHDIIGDVRGRGLFLGVELVRDRSTREPATSEAARVLEQMKERSILLSTDGPFNCVLKIKPPLKFNRANVDQFITALEESLTNLKPGA